MAHHSSPESDESDDAMNEEQQNDESDCEVEQEEVPEEEEEEEEVPLPVKARVKQPASVKTVRLIHSCHSFLHRPAMLVAKTLQVPKAPQRNRSFRLWT